MASPARETAPDPRIGMMLHERYRIVRKLGDGGMGSVYEGEHVKIKRRVAIKILHSQFAQKPEIVERFHREAEAATSIGHPNIIEVTDMGELPDGAPYMVLEFLEGRDWAHDISRHGPQPLGKVVHILSQVCAALEAAHAKGIVHRDLKPENIYLIERGGDPCFVKVLDFGISKFADAQDRSLTQTGTALGTPYYMAPEQCQGKKDVDSRADIYSLGVILFQALTAQYPFDDESYPMLVLKICTEAPPPVQMYRPDLPPELASVINRTLSKLRENRFQSCAEVRAALAPYAHFHDAPVVAADAPSTAARGPSVLSQAAGTPAPPVMTPSGTAYLASSPSSEAHTGAPTQASGSAKSIVMAALAMFVLLVLAGVTFGAVFALSGSGPEPVGVDGRAAPTQASGPSVAEPSGEAAGPAAPDPSSVAQPAEASAAEAPPAEPAEASVAVNITALPAEATIEVDGEPRPNPFDGELMPGTHHIQVSAEGYTTVDRHERFDRPRALAVALERAPRHASGSRRSQPASPQPVSAAPRPLAPAPASPAGPAPSGGGRDLIGGGGLFRR